MNCTFTRSIRNYSNLKAIISFSLHNSLTLLQRLLLLDEFKDSKGFSYLLTLKCTNVHFTAPSVIAHVQSRAIYDLKY